MLCRCPVNCTAWPNAVLHCDCLQTGKLILEGKGLPTYVFHTALHMAFFVSSCGIAETPWELIPAAQRQQCCRWMLFCLTHELGNGHAHIVVHHLVEYPSRVLEKKDVGLLERQVILPDVAHGKALVAVGGGKDRQLIATICTVNLQLYGSPVKRAHTTGSILLSDEGLLAGAKAFLNDIAYD